MVYRGPGIWSPLTGARVYRAPHRGPLCGNVIYPHSEDALPARQEHTLITELILRLVFCKVRPRGSKYI